MPNFVRSRAHIFALTAHPTHHSIIWSRLCRPRSLRLPIGDLLRILPRTRAYYSVRDPLLLIAFALSADHVIKSETLHPILQSRVGPDQFVSRILRLREDPRFRSVGPGVLEMNEDEDALEDLGEEDGLWFDFAFVEFLKTNYSTMLCCHSALPQLIFARLQSRFKGQSSLIPARQSQVVSDTTVTPPRLSLTHTCRSLG